MFLLIGLSLADVPTKLAPDEERGEMLYRENCWQCHGADALGKGPLSAALPSPPLAGRILSEDFPESVDLIQGGLGNMPAYSQVLNRHDSRRILVWLATLDPETGQGPGGDPEEEDAEGDPAPVEEADEVSQEAAVGPEKAQ
jgi:mono/diheme cytochrome c family protein